MAESASLKNLGGAVPAGESYEGKQGPNYYIPGVSARTLGSQALWLGDATSTGQTKAPVSTRTMSLPST